MSSRAAASPLYKQHSWSPDLYRDEAWLRRKGANMNRRSKSVTDEDLDELKACFELGFGFDSSPVDQVEVDRRRLSDTLPALGLYYAVNKRYYDAVSRSAKTTAPPSPPLSVSDSDSCSSLYAPSPLGSPHTIFGPGDNPQTVKTRIRQWARVVACSVRQFSTTGS